MTGGAGFIGSHLAEELVRRGERVRVVDSLITGKRANLAHLAGGRVPRGRPRRPRRRAARRRGHGLRAPPGGDPVGAAVGHRPDHLEPRQHRRHAQRAGRGPRCGRHGASSTPGRRRPTATRPRCRSTRTCRRVRCRPTPCRSSWASSTWRCSRALYGLETVTTRYFNVFGPRQDPSSPVLRRDLAVHQRARGRAAPTIYGDGEQTRDFTYVANVVDGVLRACHAPGVGGQVINVATGGRISPERPVLDALRTWSGAQVEAVYASRARATCGIRRRTSRAPRRSLGYQPLVDLREGLGRTLAWYRSEQHAADWLRSPVLASDGLRAAPRHRRLRPAAAILPASDNLPWARVPGARARACAPPPAPLPATSTSAIAFLSDQTAALARPRSCLVPWRPRHARFALAPDLLDAAPLARGLELGPCPPSKEVPCARGPSGRWCSPRTRGRVLAPAGSAQQPATPRARVRCDPPRQHQHRHAGTVRGPAGRRRRWPPAILEHRQKNGRSRRSKNS